MENVRDPNIIWYDVILIIVCFVLSLILTTILNIVKNVCCGEFDTPFQYIKSSDGKKVLIIIFFICLVLGFVLAGALLALLASISPQMFIFAPVLYPTGEWETTDVDYEDVYFQSSDQTLNGWYMECDNATVGPCIPLLYCHGSGSNIAGDYRIRRYNVLLSMGYSIFAYDYPGYGRSEGDLPTEEVLYQAGRDAYVWLKNRTGVDDDGMVILGRSFGGPTATKLAGQYDPKGLILQSTWGNFLYPVYTYVPLYAWFVYPSIGYDLNCINNMEGYNGVLWQYHSQGDEIVPFSTAQALFDSADADGITKEFFTQEGIYHDTDMQPEQIDSLRAWTEQLRNM
eukprot:TRINITY_DN13371_c0_g1_i1.p1 TRINITY_DN13371_c0_g1~~TRINITY_DN13371_c0_g1_i1.p1  ORF type:complete len:341 (-),score=50.00 TRINITY_DN13371_c0_g1_i1:31-1053(-)